MSAVESAPLVVIEANSKKPLFPFRELWAFRDLLLMFVQRDIKLKFRQTKLGVAWLFVQPLVATAGYAFLFGVVGHVKRDNSHNYFVVVMAAMLAWNATYNAYTRISQTLVLNSTLITRVYFPRLALPLSVLISCQTDNLISIVIFLIVLPAVGIGIGWHILLLIPCYTIMLTLALAFGMATTAKSVRFRDFLNVTPLTMQMALNFSPVAYSVAAAPKGLKPFFWWNPLSAPLELARAATVGGTTPSFLHCLYSAGFAVVSLLWGLSVFRKCERTFADVI